MAIEQSVTANCGEALSAPRPNEKTPGPWHVVEGRDAAGPFTVRAKLGVVPRGLMGDYRGDIIAEVQQNPSDPLAGMAEANAHLIAAAPDLFTAAKAAWHSLQSLLAVREGIPDESLRSTIFFIGAVIAKASIPPATLAPSPAGAGAGTTAPAPPSDPDGAR